MQGSKVAIVTVQVLLYTCIFVQVKKRVLSICNFQGQGKFAAHPIPKWVIST